MRESIARMSRRCNLAVAKIEVLANRAGPRERRLEVGPHEARVEGSLRRADKPHPAEDPRQLGLQVDIDKQPVESQ